jgi:hypothetical protein
VVAGRQDPNQHYNMLSNTGWLFAGLLLILAIALVAVAILRRRIMPTPTGPQTEDAFRAARRSKYAALFELYRAASDLLEQAVSTSRSLTDHHARVQDMLFLQGFKAFESIGILCEYALVEDAATSARRLLEIAVLATDIAAEGNIGLRTERAESYIARLWHDAMPEIRQAIPPEERAAYEAIYSRVASHWKNGKPPKETIFDRFQRIGAVDLYRKDYSFLSEIAHGKPPMLVPTYANALISVHDDSLIPAVLKATLRFAVASAKIWNSVFGLADASELDRLVTETLRHSSTKDAK